MTLSDHELIYLYCVTEATPDLRDLAARVDNLYWIAHRDLCAVVSNVPDLEFNEEALHQNVSDMEWLKLKVLLQVSSFSPKLSRAICGTFSLIFKSAL